MNEDITDVDDFELELDTDNSSTVRHSSPSFPVPHVETLVHCNKCDFDTLLPENLKVHDDVIHGQEVSPMRSEETEYMRELDYHTNSVHLLASEVIRESECYFTPIT